MTEIDATKISEPDAHRVNNAESTSQTCAIEIADGDFVTINRQEDGSSRRRKKLSRPKKLSKVFASKHGDRVLNEAILALLSKKIKLFESKGAEISSPESLENLFQNAKRNEVEFVKSAYEKAPEKFALRNSAGESLLHVAAAEGHLNLVHLLLKCEGINIDDQDFTNWNTALHFAVLHSHLTVIDYLILKGARTDVMNKRYMAPVHLATELNLLDSLRELVQHDEVDPNLPGENDAPPIHNAAANNLVDCAVILLEHGASLSQPNAYGLHSVHVAAKNGAKEVIDVLVRHAETTGIGRKQLMNNPDRDGNVPLHAAVDSGNPDAVRVCLEAGADIDVQQEDKSTPVHFACARKELDMLRLMFALQPEKKTTVLAMRDANGMTPLHRAVMLDHELIVEYLLDEGANSEITDLHERTPLLLAAANSASRVIRLLIKKGANVFKHDEEKRNFVHLAVINRMAFDDLHLDDNENFTEKLHLLLNERDVHGSTPLHYASGDGLLQTIEQLIVNGAEITVRNNNRNTALHFAACHGRYHSCRKLLESANGSFILNVQDCNGHSALFLAAENGHTRIVDLLLLKGALFHRDNFGQTVLHAAARNGHTQTVQLLLDANASLIDTTAVSGNTALHLAALFGHTDTVKLLMSHGAKFLLNKEEKSFLHVAIYSKNEKVTKAILQHNRWEEAMEVYSTSQDRPTKLLIELMPNAAVILLDNCVKPSEKSHKDDDFSVEYSLNFIEPKDSSESTVKHGPLPALNLMIQHGRFELLAHPCSQALLKMKWETYGRFIYGATLTTWVIYVLLLTYFVIWTNPLCHDDHLIDLATRDCFASRATNDGHFRNWTASVINGTNANETETEIVSESDCQNRLQNFIDDCKNNSPGKTTIYILLIVTVLVLLQNAHGVITNSTSFLSLWAPICIVRIAMLLCCAVFVTPAAFLGLNYISTHWQWNVGIGAMFLSWIHLFLMLQLEDSVGIYVVMFLEIMKTLIRASLIFEILLCGFGVTFHVLLKHDFDSEYYFGKRAQQNLGKLKHGGPSSSGHVALSAFRSPALSIIKVVLMMTGELDFLDTFTLPLEDDRAETLHFPIMTFVILIIFVLCIPIVVMNMLLGLALGNIETVLKDASLKKTCMQVQLHTEIEKNMPAKLFSCFPQPSKYIEYPNHCSYFRNSWFTAMIRALVCRFQRRIPAGKKTSIQTAPRTHHFDNLHGDTNASTQNLSRYKSMSAQSAESLDDKSRFTLKEVCVLLEGQSEMLRTIMQNMKIASAGLEEMEDDRLAAYLNSREVKRSKGPQKSRAAEVKQSADALRQWVLAANDKLTRLVIKQNGEARSSISICNREQ